MNPSLAQAFMPILRSSPMSSTPSIWPPLPPWGLSEPTSPIGQDFSGADLRGRRWDWANLTQTRFVGAIAGLSPTRRKLTIFLICLGATVTGAIAAVGGLAATALLAPQRIADYSAVPGLLVLGLVIFGMISTVKEGFGIIFRLSLIALLSAIVLALVAQERSAGEGLVNFFVSFTFSALFLFATLRFGSLYAAASRLLSKATWILFLTTALITVLGALILLSKLSEYSLINGLDCAVAIALVAAADHMVR